MADVTTPTLLLAAFAFFFAGLVKGTTGLGFASTCLPFLVLALGLDRAMPLVLVPSLASNMIVHVQTGHARETVQRFWPMLVATVPGLLLGLWCLTQIDLDYAAAVLGVVLVFYGSWTLANTNASLPQHIVPNLRFPVGFCTGLVNGLTGSQIVPVLPFLLAQPLPRPIFLQAINMSFTISSIVLVIGLWNIGFLTAEIAAYSTAALIPMATGVGAGTAIRNRMSSDAFKRAVLIVLIFLGLALLTRGFA